RNAGLRHVVFVRAQTGGAEPEAGAPPLISSPLAASRCVWPIHLPRSIWPCASTGAGRSFGMKTVAVIGASNNRAKFGNKAVRAFRQQGYRVYPVNPNATEIEGLSVYQSIRDVPVRPQRVTVYLPPPVLLKILPD